MQVRHVLPCFGTGVRLTVKVAPENGTPRESVMPLSPLNIVSRNGPRMPGGRAKLKVTPDPS